MLLLFVFAELTDNKIKNVFRASKRANTAGRTCDVHCKVGTGLCELFQGKLKEAVIIIHLQKQQLLFMEMFE